MRRAVGLAIATLVVTSSAVGAAQTAAKGISFVVRSTEPGISLERVLPTTNPGAKPIGSLVAEDWTGRPPGTEELVVTTHDKAGRILGTYAFSTRRLAFVDSSPHGGNLLEGGPRNLLSSEQLVTVPLTKPTAFALFWRVRVLARDAAPGSPPPHTRFIFGTGPFGPLALEVTTEGFYPFRANAALPAKLAIPSLSTAKNPPREFMPDKRGLHAFRTVTTVAVDTPPATCQFTNLGSGTANASSFNIVILGDGYKQNEMSTFKNDAASLEGVLIGTRPFSEFASNINVYVIETPSTDSGVEWCPKDCPNDPSACNQCPNPLDGSAKTTALEVSGNASGIGQCAEFTDVYPAVVNAVTTCGVVDPADVSLYIVLVNCYMYGAATYADSHTVYIARGQATAIIAHEVGHAVAPLGEEYISGVIPTPETSCGSTCSPPKQFANVALDGVGAAAAPWLYLATASEKTGGALTTIEEQSGGNVYTDTPQSGFGVGEGQTLGLYWGAQYIIEGDDPICSPCTQCPVCRVKVRNNCVTICMDYPHHGQWNDSRGAPFHRPQPYCTMRTPNLPYCRVCYCEIRRSLVLRTALTPATTWCTDTVPPGNVTDLHRSDGP
jgi:hypothetical protein